MWKEAGHSPRKAWRETEPATKSSMKASVRRRRRGSVSSCHDTRDVFLIELDVSKTPPSVFLKESKRVSFLCGVLNRTRACFACRPGALSVRAMGCRHRRGKKAVAAINRARSSGDREAVRRAVDRAKRLSPGQRDSERELRALLTGSTRGGAGTSRTARARSPTGEVSHLEGACACKGELHAGPADEEARGASMQVTSRPDARTPENLETATVGGGPV